MTTHPLARVAVLDDYQEAAGVCADWDLLRHRGVDVTFIHEFLGTDTAALARALEGFDAIIAMRERTAFPAALLRALPKLKLLVNTGRGTPHIDLQAAADAGITVCNTDGSAAGAPELTWALMLAALRHLPAESLGMRDGTWQRSVGREAAGQTIGIVGLGRIGSRVAKYAAAFDMDVAAWSPHLTPERAAAAGARYVGSLEELATQADVLTVHLQPGPATDGVVNRKVLRALGPGGLLVNTARASLVDQTAMVQGLIEGWLGGAALDVYDCEPLHERHPLRLAPRTVLTPHIGFVTLEAYRVFYGQAVEDVLAFMDGTPVRVVAEPVALAI